MKYLKRGTYDSIINEFLNKNIKYAFVEVEGISPIKLRKSLSKKIRDRNLNIIKIVLLGDKVRLEHTERLMGIQRGNKLFIYESPTIKR